MAFNVFSAAQLGSKFGRILDFMAPPYIVFSFCLSKVHVKRQYLKNFTMEYKKYFTRIWVYYFIANDIWQY
jgi:hypothetical protein